MNILFIASFRISPDSGGVQRVTETLARELKERGYNVYYLSLSKGEEEQIKGIDQYYLPLENNYNNIENSNYLKNLVKDKNLSIIINQIGFSLDALRFIRGNLRTIKIFSVHHNCLKCLNDQYRNIYFSTLKDKGIDKVFNNKISWYFLKKIHKYRFGKVIKETLNLSDKIVLLSNKFIPELGFYYKGFDKNKVIGIANPNPFNKVSIDLQKKENRIIFIGRLEFVQKRVEKLIEIWERIHINFPNWEFDIVGDGSKRELIETSVKKKGLTRIHFYGFQNPKPFLEKAKISLLTSDFEGFGLVLVEAQSFGVVPIAFNCFSAITDIIDNNADGIIIENFSIDLFISNLTSLMNNQKKLEDMAISSLRNTFKFDISNISNKWIELFEE